MILHFSHMGLTDGRTFMFPFGCSSSALALAAVAAAATPARTLAQPEAPGSSATKHPSKGDVSVSAPTGARWAAAQAAARLASRCQGVRILGPCASTATVNSKWAANEPSWA